MKHLATPRLTLRQLTPADAPFLLRLMTDPAWLKHIGDRGVRDEAAARAYILEKYLPVYQASALGFHAVIRKDGPAEPVGVCGLFQREYLPDVDLGFAFLPEARGQGLALEAAQAVVTFAKTVLKKDRLVAMTLPQNQRAIRLLENLGFVFERNIKIPDDSQSWRLYAFAFS